MQADPGRNARAIRKAAELAAGQGVELAIFPEMALPGYLPGDWLFHAAFLDWVAEEEAALIASLPRDLHVVFGSCSRRPDGVEGKAISNDAVHALGGRCLGRVAKSRLPEYDVFDEARYFGFGPQEAVWGLTVGSEARGAKLGVTVCEDIWGEQAPNLARPRYPGDPPQAVVDAGADFVLNLSASPYGRGRPAYREAMLSRLARRLGRPLALCNLVGGQDDLVFDGHSTAVDAEGRVLARAAGFAEDLVIFDWDAEGTLASLPEAAKDSPEELEEIRNALVCGLRSYVHKTGFEKVVLGLSGGIDSALVAALAVEALGPEQVTGVAMPSEYSADMSEDDAAELARRLGIHFKVMPIKPAHHAVRDAVDAALDGAMASLTDENIQPRIRGMFLMALANETRALLLATGNKSELATGYCTLYGDMCGALAPIADLVKTTVFALCRHINRTAEGSGEGPIPVRTIERPPSAELRPDQADTDSLPPYDVLDAILEAAIEESMSPAQIVELGHEPARVQDVLRLVRHNEYKRRQMPPGLRVTKKAFGRGRRFPLAAGDPWGAMIARNQEQDRKAPGE